jgi:hypothetical protein
MPPAYPHLSRQAVAQKFGRSDAKQSELPPTPLICLRSIDDPHGVGRPAR